MRADAAVATRVLVEHQLRADQEPAPQRARRRDAEVPLAWIEPARLVKSLFVGEVLLRVDGLVTDERLVRTERSAHARPRSSDDRCAELL